MKNDDVICLVNEELKRRRNMLEKYVGLTYKKFLTDYKERELALRHLQVAISCCLDIASRIAKKYHHMFEDLANKLEEAKEIRTHIIFYYLDEDYRDVHKFIQKDLGYFDDYYKVVEEYLELD